MNAPETSAGQLERDGYTVLEGLVAEGECATLGARMDEALAGEVGSRSLLRLPAFQLAARALLAHPSVAPLLPEDPVPVQATAFVKDADRRWGVGLHRDQTAPFAARVDHISCSAWSRKEGLDTCRPPKDLLDRLLAVRLQLDPGDPEAGPLVVRPGSHVLHDREIESQELPGSLPAAQPVLVPRGGALLMRPRLLHGSGRPTAPSPRRRVLHVLYGPRELPHGLVWPRF